MTPKHALQKLRTLCRSLPETAEVEAWGHPTFRVADKIFASFGHHEDRPTIGMKSTKAEQAVLVSDPRFFVPKYVGRHGWVGVWVDTDVAWDMIEDLVRESYRRVAPKRLARQLDD